MHSAAVPPYARGDAGGAPVALPRPSREMAAVVALAVIFNVSHGMVRPLIAPYAATLGAGAALAGLIVAVRPFQGFLLGVPVGSTIDRLGARRVMALGAAALAAGAGITALSGSLPGLLVGQVLLGFGGLGTGLALQAVAARPVPGKRVDTGRVANLTTVVLVGHLVGPPLGGVVTDLHGYETTFALVGALGILGLSLVSALPGPARDEHRGDGGQGGDSAVMTPASARGAAAEQSRHGALRRQSSRALDSLWAPYRRAGTMLGETGVPVIVATSGLAMVIQNLRTSFLPLLLSQMNWPASSIGLLLSLAAAAAMLSRTSLAKAERALSVRWLLGLCVGGGGAALGLAAATDQAWIVVLATTVSGFALGPAPPLTILVMSRVTSEAQRGVAVGLRHSVNRLATSVGPAALGGLAALSGLRLAFVGFSVAGAAVGTLLSRRLAGDVDESPAD